MTTTCDAESSRGPWDSQLFYREVGKVGCTAKSSPLENPAHRTMATQEATPGSQSENSALELPSTCDIRDYMLQEPSQEAPSEAVSSAEALSIPSSSEVDPVSRYLHVSVVSIPSLHPQMLRDSAFAVSSLWNLDAPDTASLSPSLHSGLQLQATPSNRTFWTFLSKTTSLSIIPLPV
ncbi:shieldin complex subunit 1 isoform X3 [Desmodus rotundus]|uniref:shieldin complex subunit 1 isoform X3 n=1 Tax=Desmodus rotundus TaxID=9430 RepID=UPI0023813A14|nr:shieldin complex subunit 1 isoform X3 [Desmodus rotundus]